MNKKIMCIKCGGEAEEILGGGYRCKECGFIMTTENESK